MGRPACCALNAFINELPRFSRFLLGAALLDRPIVYHPHRIEDLIPPSTVVSFVARPGESPDLGLAIVVPVPRALMYLASSRTSFSQTSTDRQLRTYGQDQRLGDRALRIRNTVFSYVYYSASHSIACYIVCGFWVLSLLWLLFFPLSTSGAYTDIPIVLTIVHLDGTPILFLHNAYLFA